MRFDPNKRAYLSLIAAFITISGAGAVPALTAAPSDAQLVQEFFPERLKDANVLPDLPRSAFVAADLDGTGRAEYLVAAYVGGSRGALRVIRKGKKPHLVADPYFVLMGGMTAAVELIDLDGDGRIEIIASFTNGRAQTIAWPFRWTGNSLEFLGPKAEVGGEVRPALCNALFIDFDGDGRFEIINGAYLPPDEEDPVITMEVFRLHQSKFTPAPPINFFDVYFRTEGLPETAVTSFRVDETSIPTRSRSSTVTWRAPIAPTTQW